MEESCFVSALRRAERAPAAAAADMAIVYVEIWLHFF